MSAVASKSAARDIPLFFTAETNTSNAGKHATRRQSMVSACMHPFAIGIPAAREDFVPRASLGGVPGAPEQWEVAGWSSVAAVMCAGQTLR